jgi:hypothetical protein
VCFPKSLCEKARKVEKSKQYDYSMVREVVKEKKGKDGATDGFEV